MSVAMPGVRRISLDEYEAMANDGRLGPDVNAELLDGILVPKMTKGPRHAAITRRIHRMLHEALPAGYAAFKEDPVRLPVEGPEGGGSEPEPDVMVVTGVETEFEDRHPGPGDVRLVVEVSSDARRLREDREGLVRYARNAVPCVWIVNLPANVVEVYTQPSGPADAPVFEGNTMALPGDTLTLDLGTRDDGGRLEIQLAVAELLA
jgi:Uma2 family endonuclease